MLQLHFLRGNSSTSPNHPKDLCASPERQADQSSKAFKLQETKKQEKEFVLRTGRRTKRSQRENKVNLNNSIPQQFMDRKSCASTQIAFSFVGGFLDFFCSLVGVTLTWIDAT